MLYATFNTTDGTRASDLFMNKELAQELADKQNAKAESMGIKTRYKADKTDEKPKASDKPRESLPAIWQ